MNDIDVLLLAELSDATVYQRCQFLQAMCDRDWQVIAETDVLYAAFPDTASDSEVVQYTEAEAREVAHDVGIVDFDAVCVLG